MTDIEQRTKLGDPFFVEGMGDYQQHILSESTIERIRCKISDIRTQNVSVYDPDRIESLPTLVYPCSAADFITDGY